MTTPSRVALVAAVLLSAVACSQQATVPETATPRATTTVAPVVRGKDPIVSVVRKVSPAVVNVTTSLGVQPPFGTGGTPEGTGFVVGEDGVIVTNYHVVEDATRIRVTTADGSRFDARAIGGDPAADVAVLEIRPDSPLPTLELGDSDAARLGEQVVALGFALGLQGGPSVTAGILSGKGRTIRANDPNAGVRTYEDLLQTDAAINPGNSGGPLVDLEGRVIGINTAGVSAAAAENIGFAIAIDRARPIIEAAIADPAAPSAYLGVSTQDVTPVVAAQFELSVDQGALVLGVVPGGPAEQAGIARGDVLVGFDGGEVEDGRRLQELILEHRPGDQVDVEVVRSDDSTDTVSATLGTRPLPAGG